VWRPRDPNARLVAQVALALGVLLVVVAVTSPLTS
jgi:hypothetical protein